MPQLDVTTVHKNNWDFLQQLPGSNDIVFVQELWLYDTELLLLSMLPNDFIVYAQSGMTNATQEGMIRGRPFGGVAVFIRKSFCHLTSLLSVWVCVLGDLNFECSSTDLGYSLFSEFATKLNLTSCDDLVNNNIDYTYHHVTLGHKSWLDHMFITDIMKQFVCNFTIVDSILNNLPSSHNELY